MLSGQYAGTDSERGDKVLRQGSSPILNGHGEFPNTPSGHSHNGQSVRYVRFCRHTLKLWYAWGGLVKMNRKKLIPGY
ncbi:unnamed protein product [Protopolystoma xenopodis]|uniref:Uncharacterized protein n=1 Tax=Protopolystoma xenopodis TaxID=117903 RepID=A0A3S5BW93_9PLAT|nr:unnamed protein product [Protopolystoma xenopodis]